MLSSPLARDIDPASRNVARRPVTHQGQYLSGNELVATLNGDAGVVPSDRAHRVYVAFLSEASVPNLIELVLDSLFCCRELSQSACAELNSHFSEIDHPLPRLSLYTVTSSSS